MENSYQSYPYIELKNHLLSFLALNPHFSFFAAKEKRYLKNSEKRKDTIIFKSLNPSLFYTFHLNCKLLVHYSLPLSSYLYFLLSKISFNSSYFSFSKGTLGNLNGPTGCPTISNPALIPAG